MRGRSGGLTPLGLPGALRPQPERQPGDLHGPRVDVDAVDVVLDDQARHIAAQ